MQKEEIYHHTVCCSIGGGSFLSAMGTGRRRIQQFSDSSKNCCEEHITFTLNRLVVGDKERRADELIQAYRENGFRSVLFSHDLEKPNALYWTVYSSSVGMKYQEPVFTFRYIQKEGTLGAYNLIDNPEKFTLVID